MSDLGMKKRTARLEVPGNGVGPDTFVPFGVVHGDASGPRVAVVAGVHGTELVTQDAVLALWRELSTEQVRGSVTVVFVADVLAAQAGIPGANPVDGRNLNRVWPGSSEGTFSERLAARIWKELLIQAEVVIDVHGGEWTEEVYPFAIVHSSGDAVRDRRTVELASQMGLPYLQTTAGEGTLSGAVSRSGSIGLAMEVGGGGRRPAAEVALVVNALRGVLAAAGSIEAPAEAAGEPSLTLSGGAQLRSSVAVSYTHLDVYKRQPTSGPGSRPRLGPEPRFGGRRSTPTPASSRWSSIDRWSDRAPSWSPSPRPATCWGRVPRWRRSRPSCTPPERSPTWTAFMPPRTDRLMSAAGVRTSTRPARTSGAGPTSARSWLIHNCWSVSILTSWRPVSYTHLWPGGRPPRGPGAGRDWRLPSPPHCGSWSPLG